MNVVPTPHAPKQPTAEGPASHPWLQALRGSYAYDNFDDVSRRGAIRNYYGLVSFLVSNIGAALNGAEISGLMSTTDVSYFSDHGYNLGERGIWENPLSLKTASVCP